MSIAIALGKKGSGKSALLRKICSLALHQKAALFFHDPLAQINPSRGRIYTSAAQYARDPRPRLLSIFRDIDVEAVCRLALSVGSITVVCDELDEGFREKRYSSSDSALRRIIHYGRHHRVCLLGAFRRTPNVSEDLVSQTDRAFLFHQSATCPQDIMTIRQRFGEGPAAAVQGLSFGQCVLWQDDDAKKAPKSLQQAVDAILRELPKRPTAAAGQDAASSENAAAYFSRRTTRAAPTSHSSWLPAFFS